MPISLLDEFFLPRSHRTVSTRKPKSNSCSLRTPHYPHRARLRPNAHAARSREAWAAAMTESLAIRMMPQTSAATADTATAICGPTRSPI